MSKSKQLKQYIIDTVKAETQGASTAPVDPIQEKLIQMKAKIQGQPANRQINGKTT